MVITPWLEWSIFGVFALIAIGGGIGMTTTMSMFRSGILLVASFLGVAGLYILLLADLLSFVQVMMYAGGMLVMILFMVLFSRDPGGTMMAGMMDLKGLERAFSLGLPKGNHGGGEMTSSPHEGHDEAGGHENAQQDGRGDRAGRTHKHASQAGDHDGRGEMSPSRPDGDGEPGARSREQHASHAGGHDGGDMADMMRMFTPVKRAAIALAASVTALLVGLLVTRPAWPETTAAPTGESAREIGNLLMGDYMIAFEGAGLLILLGIFGAVMLARPDRHPDPTSRDRLTAAIAEDPVPIDDASIGPREIRVAREEDGR